LVFALKSTFILEILNPGLARYSIRASKSFSAGCLMSGFSDVGFSYKNGLAAVIINR
jgi:hypothetical protein